MAVAVLLYCKLPMVFQTPSAWFMNSKKNGSGNKELFNRKMNWRAFKVCVSLAQAVVLAAVTSKPFAGDGEGAGYLPAFQRTHGMQSNDNANSFCYNSFL